MAIGIRLKALYELYLILYEVLYLGPMDGYFDDCIDDNIRGNKSTVVVQVTTPGVLSNSHCILFCDPSYTNKVHRAWLNYLETWITSPSGILIAREDAHSDQVGVSK